MNYLQTINYLYNTLPMFSRMGSAAYKKDITNIKILCEKLDNPQTKFKSIHVAGTNGKGSVSHILAAIFQTAGYKTGLHTSPHLYDFRERIKINGNMVNEDFVVDFVEKIKPVIDEIEPSFFEITVAMTFEYFSRQKVDIAIIEVGLGGRLDSTNIITPELSVITNIGWDHMNLLGNSLQEIAGEKAGIIKQNIPVVIGEKQKETAAIFSTTAEKIAAPIYFADDRFEVLSSQLNIENIVIEVNDKQENISSDYQLDLPGIYQTKNLLTVLQAVELLKEWNLKDAIQPALKNVKKLTGLYGRWEVIHEQPTIVLEVAHNKEGIEQMLEHLQKLNFNQLHIVTGTVNDKDIDKVLELLPTDAHYYFTQANIPRALDAKILQQKASMFFLKGNHYKNVNIALQQALAIASTNDLIIVCGSIFLVAEVNRRLMGLI